MGQWGLKAARGGDGPSYEELVETEGRPRLRMLAGARCRPRSCSRRPSSTATSRACREGDDLIVLGRRRDGRGGRRLHLPAPAPRPAPLPGRLLPARRSAGETDVVAFQLVTMGNAGRRGRPASCSPSNAYRDYLELHGLSVQLTEALAEYWHARVRAELGFADGEDPTTSTASSGSATAARATRSATRACPDLEDRAKIVRAARAGADRRRAVRGVPAAPRAVDRRHRRPPPRGEVLQRLSRTTQTGRPAD